MVANPLSGDGCTFDSVVQFCGSSTVKEVRRLVAEVSNPSAYRSFTRGIRLAVAVLHRMSAANLKTPSNYSSVRNTDDGRITHLFTFYREANVSYTAVIDSSGIIVIRDLETPSKSVVLKCIHSQTSHMLVSDTVPSAADLKEFDTEIVPWFNQLMHAFRIQSRGEAPKILSNLIEGRMDDFSRASKTADGSNSAV